MRFSIVIPTHNRAQLLRRTLQSVAAQDYEDWECIVVDDGGSDATQALVESMGDARFRYFWKPHGERGAARNYGVSKATGDYVYFLDSDDHIATFHLSHGREIILREGGKAVVHAKSVSVDPEGNVLQHQQYPRDLYAAIFQCNHVGSRIFVKREIVLEHRYVEDSSFSIGEDWLHLLSILAHHTLVPTDRYTLYVVEHPERSMRWGGDRLLVARSTLLSHAKADKALHGFGAARRKALLNAIDAEITSLAGLAFVVEGRVVDGLRAYGDAIRHRPGIAFQKRTAAVLLRAVRQSLPR